MEDLQLLRYAALELQSNSNDLIRVAGVAQRVKDWFAARRNKKEISKLRAPIDQAFRQLEEAIRSKDTEAVNRITSHELPMLLRDSVKGLDKIRDTMLQHSDEYVGQEGKPIAGRNLSWVSKDYQKDKSLIEKLWEMLPQAFRDEVPVGKRINQPISNFAWYKRYSVDDLSISPTVKENIWRSISKIFDPSIQEHLAPGFDQFLQNLKYSILNDSILAQVNFSTVSAQVERRYPNEMRVEVYPPEVAFPIGDSEVPIHIDRAELTDLGTRIPSKNQLSLRGIWLSHSRQSRGFKLPTPTQPVEETTASDGPITKIVKRALLKDLLPSTQAVIKVTGQTFEHKVQFARVLASALRQEIDAECSVRHQDNDIEVQVEVCGSKVAVLPAIFGISKYLSAKFLNQTKIGVDVEVVQGISKLEVVESETLDQTFRKVAFDCWRTK